METHIHTLNTRETAAQIKHNTFLGVATSVVGVLVLLFAMALADAMKDQPDQQVRTPAAT